MNEVFIIAGVFLLGYGIGTICTRKRAEERAQAIAMAAYSMNLDYLAEVMIELDSMRGYCKTE